MFSEKQVLHRRMPSSARQHFSGEIHVRSVQDPLYWLRNDLMCEMPLEKMKLTVSPLPVADYGVIEWTKNEFYCISRLVGSIEKIVKKGT